MSCIAFFILLTLTIIYTTLFFTGTFHNSKESDLLFLVGVGFLFLVTFLSIMLPNCSGNTPNLPDFRLRRFNDRNVDESIGLPQYIPPSETRPPSYKTDESNNSITVQT